MPLILRLPWSAARSLTENGSNKENMICFQICRIIQPLACQGNRNSKWGNYPNPLSQGPTSPSWRLALVKCLKARTCRSSSSQANLAQPSKSPREKRQSRTNVFLRPNPRMHLIQQNKSRKLVKSNDKTPILSQSLLQAYTSKIFHHRQEHKLRLKLTS